MCNNIGGNLIDVLTKILWHDSHRLMACHVQPPFPWLDLYSCCSLSQPLPCRLHFLSSPYLHSPLYSRPLSLESAIITKCVRGFWMWGNWKNALQFTTWGKFCPPKSNIYFFQGDTLYLSLSFPTHIAQHGIPILVLKMSHRTGQAGIGYAVQVSDLQTSVALAAVPFSAGLWTPRSHPGCSWLVMAPSKILLSQYRGRRK